MHSKQCHACRKSDFLPKTEYQGRWFHHPKDCQTISNKAGTPKKKGQSKYYDFCWELANERPKERPPRYYLLTCAQIGTGVNTDVLDCLKTLARHEGAELHIAGIKYRNQDAIYDDYGYLQEGLFANEVLPYLYNSSDTLDENLRFMTTASATNVNPITYAMSMADCNTVVGHPTRQQDAIATPSCEDAYTVISTGAVTVPNYSFTPTGDRATWNHSYGAVFVECYDNKVLCRPVTYSEEKRCCYHLLGEYYADRVEKTKNATIVLGDLHGVNINLKVLQQTAKFLEQNKDAISNVVVHDFIDFQSKSHHNNFLSSARNAVEYIHLVEEELKGSFWVLQKLVPASIKIIMVASNHNDHLDKWLDGPPPSSDCFENQLFWFKLNTLRLESIQASAYNPQLYSPILKTYAFRYLKNGHFSESNLEFISRTTPYYIAGIDISQHGDVAPGGGRGSAGKFAKCGHRLFCGHIHKFIIRAGYWTVGTSGEINPSYVRGYSPMQQGHGIIYESGSRSTLPFIETFRFGED